MQRNNISFAILLVLVLMLVCISMQDEITVTTEQPAKDTSNVEKPVQQQESTSAKEQATTTTKQTSAPEQEDDDDDSDLSPLLFAAPRFPSLLSTLFHNSDMWNMDSDFDSLFHDEDFFGLNRYRYRRPSLFTTLRNQMLRRARAAQACHKKQQQQQAETKPAAQQVQIKHIKVSSEWFEDADAYKITITVPSTVTQQQEQVHLQWNKQKRVLQLRVGTNSFEKEYRFVKPIRSKDIVAQWNTNQQLIITVPKKPTPSVLVPITIQQQQSNAAAVTPVSSQ